MRSSKPTGAAKRHQGLGVTVAALALAFAAPGLGQAAALTARGNEPGWRVELSDTALTFHGMDGESFTIAPAPRAVTANGVETYAATVAGKPFTLTVADTLCSDTMTGMPFPRTAMVAIDGRKLTGCAGEPAALLRGDWRIEEIGGAAIVADSAPALAFDAKRGISGNASCNRFFGQFALTGEGLRLSDIGMSMMMCEDPIFKQERALLTAFDEVRGFRIDSAGRLLLIGDKGETLVRARHEGAAK